jgi:hypothetical protein
VWKGDAGLSRYTEAEVTILAEVESSMDSHAATGVPGVERSGVRAEAWNALLNYLRKLMHEPLLQFLFLGALLFVVAHAIEVWKSSADHTILIDDGVIKRLSSLYEMQMGPTPSPARIDGMIDDYVHDEILYREAIKSGLDQDDEIIRRRLIQKIEFLNRDLTVVAEPTDTELKLYYERHRNQFIEPGKVTFSHIYFSPDNGGTAAALQRARDALAQLQTNGATMRAPQLGDRFPLQYDYAQLSRLDAVQIFGQTPIVDALFALPTGQWAGPIQSGYGWHLVFIGTRSNDSVPPLEQILARVRDAYVEQARQDNNRRQYEELKSHYTVVRAGTPQGSR